MSLTLKFLLKRWWFWILATSSFLLCAAVTGLYFAETSRDKFEKIQEGVTTREQVIEILGTRRLYSRLVVNGMVPVDYGNGKRGSFSLGDQDYPEERRTREFCEWSFSAWSRAAGSARIQPVGPEVAAAGGEYVSVPMEGAVTDGNLVTGPAWTAHVEWLKQFLSILG